MPSIIDARNARERRLMTFAKLLFSLALAAGAVPAQAAEVFGGIYDHDVKLPTDKSGIESGVDFQVGYRGGSIGHTRLQPYIFGALNSAGNTSYAAAGLSIKFGDRLFVRPGLGLAIHNGSADQFYRTDKIAFGSRVLFEPEVGVGLRVSRRATVEASWVHMSHAQLFSRENPGIDNLGVRVSLGL
jgi:lipid A 3-O-deacylase